MGETKRQWTADGCGMGLAGDKLAEVLHLVSWAAEKVKDIERGGEELARAREVVAGDRGGVSLAVVGMSGADKTAFVAKLAQL